MEARRPIVIGRTVRSIEGARPSVCLLGRHRLPRWSMCIRVEDGSIKNRTVKSNFSVKYTTNKHDQHIDGELRPHASEEQSEEVPEMDVPVEEVGAPEKKRAAKIHDFCFGIPFGGLVFGGGLVGFIFSRNLATLGTGVLYGGALLALSIISLKVWRQGKSCLPFILGQGAIAATLLAKNFQTYNLTKKLFPTGFYAFMSAAMLCFYSYVLISGGNPPPKKSKLATNSSS
ncbi:hypothetical protein QJS10_CPA03g00114 [Acorus calamus]|uniref:Uncharacterized protein n=1 Tax=Acorus calamus TaxID=4465 RepID=A0AAV9F359_ACOCL|nr:hypothetical protein QJS10_CPA03g00110 [Acorus calamus]KAK1320063.1 hypothetical protein QJS10_CPA03g00114 [Acorus calamus]